MRKFLRVLTILSIAATLFLVLMSFIVYTSVQDPTIGEKVRWAFIMPTMVVSGCVIILSMAGNFVYAMVGDVWKSAKELEELKIKYYNGVLNVQKQKNELAELLLENKQK